MQVYRNFSFPVLVTRKKKIISIDSSQFQALAGEGGYAEPRDLPRGPIVNERYYDPYRVRLPLDYGMTRTYSGDYIGPGATSVSRS